MSYSIEPAYTMVMELSRQLVRASTSTENQWFFPEKGFSASSLDHGGNFYLNENFVVICKKRIVAYFEAHWARPLNNIHNFRLILFDKHRSLEATRAFFDYLDYLFMTRGCQVFSWSVAEKNAHALCLYEKFIRKYCGHRIGKRTRSFLGYSGEISDTIMYELTREEYLAWKDRKK